MTDVTSPQPPDPSDVPASSAGGAPDPRDAPASSAGSAPGPGPAGQETPEAHELRHAPHVDGNRLGVPEGTARYVADYGRANPSYVFLFVVAGLSLLADIGSKTWAEKHLEAYPGMVDIWRDHLTLILAKNRGGAWGLLQTTSESIRRPFFLLVSVAAILFIMTLYRRLQPRQMALRWGLPFVLGGALGNVFDRVRYGQVIDFIDAHARWGGQEHHWPTFNIADVCICVGVGLMAIDMFSNKRGTAPLRAPRVPPAQSGEPVPAWQDPEGDAPPGHADGSSVTPSATNDEGAKA